MSITNSNANDVGNQNIADISIKPEFEILDSHQEATTSTASSRINLSINSSKFRLQYLFHTEKIPLIGKIYNKECFDIFLKIACVDYKESDDVDSLIKKNSLYLYTYADIWGFDELKERIKQYWIEDNSLLEIKVEGKNWKFLKDIINFFEEDINSDIKQDNLFYITPIEFFIHNINILLEKNCLIGLPPEFLNNIIQKVEPSNLDGKVYFEFFIKIIEKAQEKNEDLIPYSALAHYIDFSQLGYDDLHKYIEMKFQSKYEEYFDFLTFRQFKSFAKKMIDENEQRKTDFQDLKEQIDDKIKSYDTKIRKMKDKQKELQKNINKLKEENQNNTINTIKDQLLPLKASIDYSKDEIGKLHTELDNLKGIKENADVSRQEIEKSLVKLESKWSKVNEIEKQYQISSYVVSAINQQFIPIKKNKDMHFTPQKNLYLYENIKNDILCETEIGNLEDDGKFSFDPIVVNSTNPIIYFQIKHKGDQERLIDLFIKEYELESTDTSDVRSILSWRLEGYFPDDLQDYSKSKIDIKDITDENWFPIIIHSVSDFTNLDENNQEQKNIYKWKLDFSPICRCLRFRMVRNSIDDEKLTIKRIKIYGRALQPFDQK